MSEPQTAAGVSADAAKVLIHRRNAGVEIVLNRPAVLNAFDDEMRSAIAAEIPRIARNADVYAVMLRSASAKAFCAGGDIRALTLAWRRDPERVKSYFRGEYRLNWLLDCFSKPTVSFIDGLCMGSGAGLTCYNTHRVAGEKYKFAMPETAIGLFPDVGVSHVLAQRMPWPIGLYLGLTGESVGREDAYWLGLATHCLPGASFAGIIDKLNDSYPIDDVLDTLQAQYEVSAGGPLKQNEALIEDLFSADHLSGIIERLEAATGTAAGFAAKTLADLTTRSPMALAITDRHIRSCRKLDLRETLRQDYRLAVRCLEGKDFHEGVRAMIIDKDRTPAWQPRLISDVKAAAVDAYFAPLAADELELPSRAEMQAARV